MQDNLSVHYWMVAWHIVLVKSKNYLADCSYNMVIGASEHFFLKHRKSLVAKVNNTKGALQALGRAVMLF